jgi:hypothetical protein
MVDDPDFPAVSKFRWHAQLRGRHVYAARNVSSGRIKRLQYLHRFLLPGTPSVDHINGDGLDNRRHNLRSATQQENSRAYRKKRIGVTSAYRGVSWDSEKARWVCRIRHNGKQLFCGRFDSEEQAARMYDYCAALLFGPFAQVNFA